MTADQPQTLDLFQGNYQDPRIPHWRADLQRMLADAFYMRHYPDLFPHDYAAGMCGSLSKRLWEADGLSYQDYVRYCRFASKLLGRDLRQLYIRIDYEHAFGVGPTMPEGHNSPQESIATGTSPSRAKPCPRLVPEAKHPQTASERFLARFGAGATLAAPNALPRAMNNTGFAHGTAPNGATADASALAPSDPTNTQAHHQHTRGGQQ